MPWMIWLLPSSSKHKSRHLFFHVTMVALATWSVFSFSNMPSSFSLGLCTRNTPFTCRLASLHPSGFSLNVTPLQMPFLISPSKCNVPLSFPQYSLLLYLISFVALNMIWIFLHACLSMFIICLHKQSSCERGNISILHNVVSYHPVHDSINIVE